VGKGPKVLVSEWVGKEKKAPFQRRIGWDYEVTKGGSELGGEKSRAENSLFSL